MASALSAHVAASPAIFFFRHIHFDQCIVSPTFLLRAMHMAQTGNPHTPVRHDKWIPFLVATDMPKTRKGSKEARIVEIFYNELIRDLFSLKHGEKVRTPAFRNPEDTEILQQRQKAVVQKFCSKLTLDRYAEVFGHGSNINEAGKAPEQAPPTQKPLKLLWERMADRESILGETDLQWPSWVQHDQLLLNRGRFPMNVEGMDQNLLIKRAPRAAGPKKEARQKALWEVADALSGKKKDKRRY